MTALTTTAVKVLLRDPKGSIPTDVTVTATLVDAKNLPVSGLGDGIVVSAAVSSSAVDSEGKGTLNLWPNELGSNATMYRVVIRSDKGILGTYFAQVPVIAAGGSIALESILAVPANIPVDALVSFTARLALLEEMGGTPGAPGASAYEVAQGQGFQGPVGAWLASLVGAAGKSAYQVAQANGYQGSASQWLASLAGAAGASGKSAYQVAQANGFPGTEAQWLTSLVGTAGLSAYQVAVATGYSGTASQWIASLKGADGSPGKSAYQSAVDAGFQGTEAQWVAASKNTDYLTAEGTNKWFTATRVLDTVLTGLTAVSDSVISTATSVKGAIQILIARIALVKAIADGAVSNAKANAGLSNVDNTSDINKPVSTLTNAAIEASKATITKAYLGLGNVDNTADTAKPLSAAQKTYVDNTKTSITAASLGLGNVNNTSDANKPVSTLTASAIAQAKSEAIIAPTAYATGLPAWVDGAIAPIDYSGLAASVISNELAPSEYPQGVTVEVKDGTGAYGSTSERMVMMTVNPNPKGTSPVNNSAGMFQIAFRGNDGRPYMRASANNANYWSRVSKLAYQSDITKNFIGLNNVDNTSDVNKPVSTLTASAIAQAMDSIGPMSLYNATSGARTLTDLDNLTGFECVGTPAFVVPDGITKAGYNVTFVDAFTYTVGAGTTVDDQRQTVAGSAKTANLMRLSGNNRYRLLGTK